MYLTTLVALAALTSGGAAPAGLVAHADTMCPSRNVPIEGRKSPLDSVTFTVSSKPIKVCYSRPSARGRTMLGGKQIPYGKLWRTGANEPTIFFTQIPLYFAGIQVPAGVYSLYTIPGPREWFIIVNRSTTQWGEESNYTSKVKGQELGRTPVERKGLKPPVETFTIRGEPGNTAGSLVLEWESTQVRIPVSVEPLAKGDVPARYAPAAGKS